jgi:hypothetical protein
MQDISPNWKGSTIAEQAALAHVLRYEGTPMAIVQFEKYKHVLDDYWYWFTLSTLWVSYSGYSDLKLWRRLFQSGRPGRRTSLMKPSEWESFKAMPNIFTAYRAHRPSETDWISYTLDKELVDRWAQERDGYVRSYTLNKLHCLALFLRRGETEILMLSPKKAKLREEG